MMWQFTQTTGSSVRYDAPFAETNVNPLAPTKAPVSRLASTPKIRTDMASADRASNSGANIWAAVDGRFSWGIAANRLNVEMRSNTDVVQHGCCYKHVARFEHGPRAAKDL